MLTRFLNLPMYYFIRSTLATCSVSHSVIQCSRCGYGIPESRVLQWVNSPKQGFLKLMSDKFIEQQGMQHPPGTHRRTLKSFASFAPSRREQIFARRLESRTMGAIRKENPAQRRDLMYCSLLRLGSCFPACPQPAIQAELHYTFLAGK